MKKRYFYPVYESEALAQNAMNNPDPSKPVRYSPVDLPVPLWQKLWLFAKHGKWVSAKRYFFARYPGTPGYDQAPYEAVEVKKP